MSAAAFSRRGVLGAAGAVVAGAAVAGAATGAAATWLLTREGDGEAPVAAGSAVPFYGTHQAGIASAVQDRMHITAFDITSRRPGDVVRLLKAWSQAAATMTAGLQVGEEGAIPLNPEAPPDDTGEALNLPPSRLTLTIGFGAGMFEKGGKDRFGVGAHRPAGLIDLPHFAGDNLDPARSGGDIVVQACADDPQVAVHAIRNLARIGFGTVAVRWSQLGFGKTSSTTPSEQTPRNLFGFKDGTKNIAGDDAARLRDQVWVSSSRDGEPGWLEGGSFLVARRISMRVETWDRTSLGEQEAIVGRTKRVGAPLGQARERDEFQLSEATKNSHVGLARPESNDGHAILRRGYSFVDGSDGLGRLDAGLFFVAFCRDPRLQYVPLQSKLSNNDVMQEYVQHTGSGLYAVPPGPRDAGDYWGSTLFDA
jgi:deferrochelatase/peroxidase EfeB